jgi:hypothetical protein
MRGVTEAGNAFLDWGMVEAFTTLVRARIDLRRKIPKSLKNDSFRVGTNHSRTSLSRG